MAAQSIWTETEFQAAIKMRADGRSAAEIARELGKTRNAVMGIMHRNRDVFPKKETPAPMVGRPRKDGTPPRQRHHMTTTSSRPIVETPRVVAPPVLPEEPIVEIEAAPIAAEPVTFLAVSDRQCKWPLWAFPANPGGDGLCCGARIELGETYCGPHWVRARGKGTRSEQTAVDLLARAAR